MKKPQSIPSPKVDARYLSEDGQTNLRTRGMQMLEAGISQREIASRLGVHRQTVLKWNKRRKTLPPEEAVKNEKRGPKESSCEKIRGLNRKQQEVVRRHIIDKTPRQMRFDFALWTTRAIAELIVKLYQIRLSRNTICRCLREWGMTPQRPKKRAIQQNPELVKKWLEEDYPRIVHRAHAEGGRIFWEDETSIQQDTNFVRGYSPEGQTPTIQQDRKSCCGAPVMMSAVNNQGRVYFRFQKGSVDSQAYIKFLVALLEDNPSVKIFLIADNARFHHARIVREWTEEYKERIELFFLPAYTPERNPDEYLNRQIKTELRNKPAMNHKQALEVAKDFMEKVRTKGSYSIRKLFESNDVRYARWKMFIPCPYPMLAY